MGFVATEQTPRNRAAALKKTMRRHGAKNADYRGGVTCLYDTQLLGACLHAFESSGRSRPEAVRVKPDVPIAPPSHRAPEPFLRIAAILPGPSLTGVTSGI
jgi:hypothetical protein